MRNTGGEFFGVLFHFFKALGFFGGNRSHVVIYRKIKMIEIHIKEVRDRWLIITSALSYVEHLGLSRKAEELIVPELAVIKILKVFFGNYTRLDVFIRPFPVFIIIVILQSFVKD